VYDWLAVGHEPKELIELSRAAIERTERGLKRLPPGRWPGLKTVQEFIAQPRRVRRWLVDHTLIQGGTSLLVSKPKAGKSTLARDLLRATLGGGQWLGRSIHSGAAIYYAMQEHPDELADQFSGEAFDGPLYVFNDDLLPSTDEERSKMLAEQIEYTAARLVIIDMLADWCGVADFNSYMDVRNALRPLNRLARESAAHVMVLHHTNKAATGQDSINGSIALAGAVDTMLFISRDKDTNVRTLSSEQRYGQDIRAFQLNKPFRGDYR
jgi:RecA-family ATPase